MKLRQVPVLSTDLELNINMSKESGIDISEYNWFSLGFVDYGMKNDVGYSRLFVKMGIKRDAKNQRRFTMVEVVEKYYSCEGNYDYEEYEIHHSPRNEPHNVSIVYYNCPRDFDKVLETIIGEDHRTKIEREI